MLSPGGLLRKSKWKHLLLRPNMVKIGSERRMAGSRERERERRREGGREGGGDPKYLRKIVCVLDPHTLVCLNLINLIAKLER